MQVSTVCCRRKEITIADGTALSRQFDPRLPQRKRSLATRSNIDI